MDNNTATIGFWLLIGAQKQNMFMVCPALVQDGSVEDIKELSIQTVWSVAVQGPVDAHKDTVMLLVPEVITVKGLAKPASKMKHLFEIQAVRDKCEVLTKKYINHVKEISQRK